MPGAIGNVPRGSFIDAFFFSIETLATVGYGSMVPASRYGHVISAIEILCGVIYTAVVTGVIFIRFSKPKAKVVYAERPVIANHHGCPTLMIRIANGRAHMLTDASVRLSALMAFSSPEGQQFRRMQTLDLSMSHIPMFALTWTLMHPIDAKSPLHGQSAESMIANNIRLMLNFEAHDPTLSVQVHDLRSYAADTIAFGMRYADAIFFDAEGRAPRRHPPLQPDRSRRIGARCQPLKNRRRSAAKRASHGCSRSNHAANDKSAAVRALRRGRELHPDRQSARRDCASGKEMAGCPVTLNSSV